LDGAGRVAEHAADLPPARLGSGIATPRAVETPAGRRTCGMPGPGGVPPFQLASTCEPDSYIAYGEGSTTSAACSNARANANSDCMAATDSMCCFITVCEGCVGGTSNFSCWLHYKQSRILP